MASENSGNQPSTRKRSIAKLEANKSTAVLCTVVAIDHTNIFYKVCSVCERTLPEILPPSSSPICGHSNDTFNLVSTGSKRLFRVLMSVATDTKVFVVIMFDRVAKVLFGCSADEFFHFANMHPSAGKMASFRVTVTDWGRLAVTDAGKILGGEMLRATLSKPKNGNAQHVRVTSVLPLHSRFQPAILTLREMYRLRSSS